MNPNDRQPADSYYQASRRYAIEAAQLRGAHKADVVVIGGGITGVSTALHLAEKGVDVAVLESRDFGWGASGRSGGQIITGYSADQQALEKLVGMDTARVLWEHSVAALAWTRRRIERHRIDCDLVSGYLHAGVKPGHARELQAWAQHLATHYDCKNLEYLDRAQVRRIVGSTIYSGAVSDPDSGHLHPLNYCLGLAQAAQQAGARLYRDSAVTRVQVSRSTAAGPGVTVHIGAGGAGGSGTISCDKVVYGCNAYLHRLQPRLAKMIMPVATCIIATEPLSERVASALIANRAAVADTQLVLDYFRLSADNRMLFGGRVSYLGLEPRRLMRSLRRRMLKVFPQLRDARIDFSWGGYVAITRNRAPHIGQLDPSSWFAQGFSGHGMALTGYVGGLLADAVMGATQHIECFRKIPHKAFPGGPALRTPALVVGMAGRRLLDKLA